jgi:hypothetical protein
VTAKRPQHCFDLPAEVWFYPNAAFVQRVQERLRNRCAKQYFHVQCRHVARERFHRERTEEDFPSSRFHAAPSGHNEQACGRVE